MTADVYVRVTRARPGWRAWTDDRAAFGVTHAHAIRRVTAKVCRRQGYRDVSVWVTTVTQPNDKRPPNPMG